jgi:hypothetical protein
MQQEMAGVGGVRLKGLTSTDRACSGVLTALLMLVATYTTWSHTGHTLATLR